jgi:hypothetical protein
MKNQTMKDRIGMILRSVEGKVSQPLKSLAAHNRLTWSTFDHNFPSETSEIHALYGLEMQYKSKESTWELFSHLEINSIHCSTSVSAMNSESLVQWTGIVAPWITR